MRQEKKTLVAYFSATGTTARAAKRIAKMTGGDLYRITPEQPYTTADLDWHDANPKTVLTLFALALLLAANACVRTEPETLSAKMPIQPDAIVRLSKIEVYPDYVEE